MISKLTFRGLRSHPMRFILAAFAVVLGVSFVSGAFVLSDSLRNTFDSLFSETNKGIDAQVRTKIAFGDTAQAQRDPVPASVLDQVKGVDGVDIANGTLFRTAPLLDKNGKAIQTQGAPTAAIDFGGESALTGTKLLEGRAPKGDTEAVIDGATADRHDFVVGDQITAVLDAGKRSFTIVGLIGQGDQRGFAGATIVGFDPAVAGTLLNTGATFDAIDVHAKEGVTQQQMVERIAPTLPDNLEVVTGDTVRKETTDAVGSFISIFGNVLLGFAGVALFVSTFIINNTFRIIVGQRVRELALLRAVGADAKQVRRMVVAEALVIGVVSSLIGLVGGIGVAKGLVALFNAGGAGFPSSSIILASRTIIVALVIGIGVTLVSALAPALRAARIPPVAAMRPEMGFESRSSRRRLVVGGVVTVLAIALLGLGLFARPGGTLGTIGLSAIGAVMLFLGVASLSATFAKPASLGIGAVLRRISPIVSWPFKALRRGDAGGSELPPELGRQNAARAPRRTAATASALMIGLALVSTFSVVASSVKSTFSKQLSKGVQADYLLSDQSFQGFSPELATKVAALPQIDSVTPFRFTQFQVNGDGKAASAVDPATFGRQFNIGLRDGSIEAMADDGVLVQKDPAKDLNLKVGDPLTLTWQNGTTTNAKVAGIFDDAGIVGNWVVSIKTLEKATPTAAPRDTLVSAKLKDGADPVAARTGIEAAASGYPQVRIEDQAEFRQRQIGQINQLLAIINGMLALAILIALLGIANTLALSVFERTRELGLLRAVGMSRRQMKRTIRWEAVIVAVFGALLGIAIGTPLGAALSSALPKTIIDGITVPFGQLVTLLGVALVAGVVAAYFPARRAARMNVLDAIASD